MASGTLSAALEREHTEIDAAVDAFIRGTDEHGQLATLRGALDALRRHIYLEEEFLFPPLRAVGLFGPIMVMLREHGQMWQTMSELGTALDHDPDAALGLCRELVAQLDAHNSKEETILYPQADAVLTGEASADLVAFMASGRLPDGWICQMSTSSAGSATHPFPGAPPAASTPV
ncbi:MAG: hemerythrin domain-containing protein [Nocardioidaceae bacterium]